MKLIFISILMLGFMTGSAFAGQPAPLKDIELKWKATTDLKDLVATNLGSIAGKVNVVKFKDARTIEPKNKVGENKEDQDKGVLLPVTTTTNISDFVSDNFTDVLKKSGLNVSPTDSEYTLSGEITDYFVTEINTYQGSLIVKLVLSKGNKVLWQGTVMGTNTRFGRSYKLENYQETLSDLIVDLATKLAQNAAFRAQLK